MRVSLNAVGLLLLSSLPFSLQAHRVETASDNMIDPIDDESVQNFSFSETQPDSEHLIEHSYPGVLEHSACLYGNTETCSGIRHPRWRANRGKSVYDAQLYFYSKDGEDMAW